MACFAFSCSCTYVISVFLVMESNGFTGTLWNADAHLFGRQLSTHSLSLPFSDRDAHFAQSVVPSTLCVCVCLKKVNVLYLKNTSSLKTPVITEIHLHNVLLHTEAIISILDTSEAQTLRNVFQLFRCMKRGCSFSLLTHSTQQTQTHTNQPAEFITGQWQHGVPVRCEQVAC